MAVQGIRSFRLSQPGRSGISCDATGAFMDDIPLLKRSDEAESSIWMPRPCDEISREISSRYGLPIDFSSRAGGLSAIARALNDDNVALAQIATVQLAIPDPPPLSKGVPSLEALKQFIHELSWSGLLKSDWDPDEHPRWPAGSPDSQGGQFAPKDELLGTAAGDSSANDDASAGSDTTGSRAASIGQEGDDHSDPALLPAVERSEGEDLFDPVVYRGYLHDEIVNGLAQQFRNNGWKAQTEVSIAMADGSAGTRIDLLVKGPNTPVIGFEVKTGEDPPFTKAQLYVYPHLMMGASVLALYDNIRAVGLLPKVPLPPIPVLLYYVRDRSSKPIMGDLSISKMLAELKRLYGKIGKFVPELLGKEETSEMPEREFDEGKKQAIMMAHAFGGRVLASREIALAMAEMMVRETYGEEHLKTQLPLQITDRGDRWLIEGSRRGEDYPDPPEGFHQDKVIIEIRKQDCQVVNFALIAF